MVISAYSQMHAHFTVCSCAQREAVYMCYSTGHGHAGKQLYQDCVIVRLALIDSLRPL